MWQVVLDCLMLVIDFANYFALYLYRKYYFCKQILLRSRIRCLNDGLFGS